MTPSSEQILELRIVLRLYDRLVRDLEKLRADIASGAVFAGDDLVVLLERDARPLLARIDAMLYPQDGE